MVAIRERRSRDGREPAMTPCLRQSYPAAGSHFCFVASDLLRDSRVKSTVSEIAESNTGK